MAPRSGRMDVRDYPDWDAVVHQHWRDTPAFMLAMSPPCTRIRDEELEAIGNNRALHSIEAADLASWTPPRSWLLAVLVCPGDDLAPLTAWVGGAAIDRVRFYVHADADPFDALAAWADAGFPDPIVDDGIDSWRTFHRRFGRDLAVRILQDWA